MKRKKTDCKWTHKQTEQLALFMWSHPSATEEERAKCLGVSRATLWRYWKDESFCAAVTSASNLLKAKAQPLVDAALVRKAIGGDISAIRLFYQISSELSDKHDDARKAIADVTVTIRKAQIENDKN